MTTPAPRIESTLPPGVDGVRATLRTMVGLTRKYKTDADVRNTALSLTRQLAPKDYTGELRALQHFVRDKVRYVRDIRGVETVQTPKETLRVLSGDCDDKATLLASLLESIGTRTRFVAVGVRDPNAPYSHVLAEGLLGTRWIPLETILRGIEPGWFPPDAQRAMVAHV